MQNLQIIEIFIILIYITIIKMCTTCNDEINNGLIPTGATGAQGPIGPAGPTGPQGPQGDPGPAGTQEKIIFQSSSAFGTLDGLLNIGDNNFTGLEVNLFKDATPRGYILWLDMNIESEEPHTCTFYFKKNGVQVGLERKVLFNTFDQVHFKTDIISFSNTDAVTLFINTTTTTASIKNATLHSLWQVT
jgi:hypothetical protein